MDKNIYSNYHLRGDLKEVIPILTRAIEQLDHKDWIDEVNSYRRPFDQLQIGDFVNPQTLIEKSTPQLTTIRLLLPMSVNISFGRRSSINSSSREHFSLPVAWAQWVIQWARQSAVSSDVRTKQLLCSQVTAASI